MTEENHEIRDVRRRLKLANRVMGRQGAAIAALRGELARTREDNSKIDRGELRRLERDLANALDAIFKAGERAAAQHEEITRLREENTRLREKLDKGDYS